MSPPSTSLPPATRQLLTDAGKALSQGQHDLAVHALRRVLADAPTLVDAQVLYGVASLMRGDSAIAVEFLRKAVQQRPDDANIQMSLGSALHDSGAADEGLAHLRRACELAPAQASAWYNLGKALKLQWKLEEAEQALRRALALNDRYVLARISLADICTIQGDIPQAVKEYRHVLQQNPEQAEAWHALANLKTEPLSLADVEHIRRALRNPATHSNARVALGFSLFKALEDQHDYAGAFEVLCEANANKRRLVQWDAAAEHARIEATMEAFRQPIPTPLDPMLGKEAILIVSMPRSGSTLVEQILAAHPQVEGANEIPDLPQIIEEESRRREQPFPQWVTAATAADWARLGSEYLARTARWRERRPFFTDKGLLNWQWVGAVRAMLPGAKIVHCYRDPVDTCFSCYRQLFNDGIHYSYDLTELAEHYRDYQRLSAYWLMRFPGWILDFSYEALLHDPEMQIRRLLAFCELPFDPACLSPHKAKRNVYSTASAAQVRQAIRQDTTRNAPYIEWLKPLRDRLAS
jgi:Flp pilus assembly protein TadD